MSTPNPKTAHPLIFDPEMSTKEPKEWHENETLNDSHNLHVRLRRMKKYYEWAKTNAPKQCVKEADLKRWLERSGYDPELSAKIFAVG